MIYAWVAHQLCWVHKMWNVLGKVHKVDQEALKRGLQEIYLARTRKAASQTYLRWARRCSPEVSKSGKECGEAS